MGLLHAISLCLFCMADALIYISLILWGKGVGIYLAHVCGPTASSLWYSLIYMWTGVQLHILIMLPTFAFSFKCASMRSALIVIAPMDVF